MWGYFYEEGQISDYRRQNTIELDLWQTLYVILWNFIMGLYV